ncbi:MAG: hypothetical protein R8G66_18025 [Cytophagales bacterium]|nr:hypothetical protein [Cytophagales bacterium]
MSFILSEPVNNLAKLEKQMASTYLLVNTVDKLCDVLGKHIVLQDDYSWRMSRPGMKSNANV